MLRLRECKKIEEATETVNLFASDSEQPDNSDFLYLIDIARGHHTSFTDRKRDQIEARQRAYQGRRLVIRRGVPVKESADDRLNRLELEITNAANQVLTKLGYWNGKLNNGLMQYGLRGETNRLVKEARSQVPMGGTICLNPPESSPDDDQEFWNDKWQNMSYYVPTTIFVRRMLAMLDRQSKIGNAIADFGAAKSPVSDELVAEGRKIAQIDRAGTRKFKPHGVIGIQANLRMDMNSVLDEVNTALEVDKLDCAILSRIMNYVDWKKLLRLLKISSGGRLILFNKPQEGHGDKFFENGVENNAEVLALAENELGYEVEYLIGTPVVRDQICRFWRHMRMLAVLKKK